jgi:hypothetical protein
MGADLGTELPVLAPMPRGAHAVDASCRGLGPDEMLGQLDLACVVHLKINVNRLGDRGLEVIMTRCELLEELDASANSIHSLPDTVPPRLRVLLLNYNQLRGSVARLATVTSLQSLHLDQNMIPDHAAMDLLAHPTLTHLSLDRNGLSPGCIPDTLGPSLSVLSLSGNPIGDEGALRLAEALGPVPLHTLRLAQTRINERAAVPLIKAFGGSRSRSEGYPLELNLQRNGLPASLVLIAIEAGLEAFER